MRVEVVIAEWEQTCCGAPFAVGEPITWQVEPADPQPAQGPPRFAETHHELGDDGSLPFTVSGTVRRITGLAFPSVPIAGAPRSFRADPARAERTPVQSVAGGTDNEWAGFAEYVVEVEVADDARLPLAPTAAMLARRRWQEARAERMRARREDTVHDALVHHLVALRDRWGEAAEWRVEADLDAVSAVPRRAGAVALRWSRSEDDDDGIAMFVGDARFILPATVESVEQMTAMSGAVTAGRVLERVRERGGARFHDTVVHAADGTEWVASSPLGPVGSGGVVVMTASQADLVAADGRTASPWG